MSHKDLTIFSMKPILAIGAALALTGCMANSVYYNPHISSSNDLERQRVIDEGYCTQVAVGSVALPKVRNYARNPSTYNVYGVVSGTDAYGNSFSHNVDAQIIPSPSSGQAFSDGFEKGMEMGRLIKAKKERQKVMDACMYRLGWTTNPEASMWAADENHSIGKNLSINVDLPSRIYSSEKEKWLDEVSEFLMVFDIYDEDKNAHSALDNEVKKLASGSSKISGSELLFQAHQNLIAKRRVTLGNMSEEEASLAEAYGLAAQNDAQGFAGMALYYFMMKLQPDSPPAKRGAYWAKNAFEAGDKTGALVYSIFLFRGVGLPKNRVEAYKILYRNNKDGLANEILKDFESKMSANELRSASMNLQ